MLQVFVEVLFTLRSMFVDAMILHKFIIQSCVQYVLYYTENKETKKNKRVKLVE